MISSYTITTQTLATNDALIFSNDRIKTGCTVLHFEGTPTFTLNKTGYYFISFNADVAGTGDIVIQLQNNGVLIPGASATNTSTGTTDIGNMSFTTIVQAPPSCCAIDNTPRITLVNTGDAATITNANLVITKLC